MADIRSIKKHISSQTQISVQQRGKVLYNEGKVNLVDSVKEDGILKWDFQVQGSKLYDIQIIETDDKILALCSCPYNWGPTCKHTVASLLHIIDTKGGYSRETTSETATTTTQFGVTHETPIAKRVTSQPYVITDFATITDRLLQENTTDNIYRYLDYFRGINLESVDINLKRIVFTIGYDYTRYKVVFEYSNNKILVSSSEKSQALKLKRSEALCLKLVERSKTPNLFAVIFTDELGDFKKQVANNYGMETETDFDNNFKLAFKEYDGLYASLLDNSQGLLPLGESEKVINILGNNLSDSKYIIPNSNNKKERRKLGFVIDPNYFNRYRYGDLITPIIAKPNKADTELSTHFKQYDDYIAGQYSISINESTKSIINKIEDIDNNSKDKEISHNNLLSLFTLLQNEEFVYIFRSNYNKLSKHNLTRVKLADVNAELYYKIVEDKQFVIAQQKIKIGDEILNISEFDNEYTNNHILFKDNTLYAIVGEKHATSLEEYPDNFKMALSNKDEFYENVVRQLSSVFEIDYSNSPYKHNAIELDFNKRQLFISEQDEYVVFTPQVIYSDTKPVVLRTTGNIVEKSGNEIVEYKRNRELEDDFINELSELHPYFEQQKHEKVFYLHYHDFTDNMWFYKFFDKLNVKNIEIYGLKNLKNFKYSPHKGKVSTSVSSGQDWFDVEIKVTFGDNTVGLADIRKAVINKQKYIQLKDGSVGILPEEWLHKLEKYFRNGTVRKDKLEISNLRFSIIDELFDDIDEGEIFEQLAEKRKRIANFKEISQTEVPKEITADLRHYQKEGLNWLNFLDEMKWGGILADDMGLGKTLQILTFIQHIIKKDSTPSLIIIPTSLLFNWRDEIAKFAPEIKAHYYYGLDRNKNTKEFEKYNLVFTTYGVLLRDIELLSKFKFNYVILDESQAIKNPASRRFKATNLLSCNNRIALTGTPIENGTFDLFAQMSFVNPGIFAGASNFKENYSNPIDRDGDEIIATELQKLINPFLLRRTKEKVASELPAKTEDVIYCEMESEQRKVYDAYRNKYRDKLLNNVEENGMGKSKMMVLEALTRLRQICDSPTLLNSDEQLTNQSVKINEIVSHITNKTANHKILIFSQFVSMLSLIKDELDKLNITYEYLDGKSSTKQRENSVNNFQNDDNLRVFLISLKAGGTGLNLTAADYVYIVDPWWNPAVENQAIDRCYRIGQDKKVFAYRMICKNTVEEKILNLQAKKKKIASDIIQTDENIMKTLKVEDIKDLFG